MDSLSRLAFILQYTDQVSMVDMLLYFRIDYIEQGRNYQQATIVPVDPRLTVPILNH